MLMMHDAGLIKVEWDKNGNPIRVVELSGTMSRSSSVTGELSVGHDKKDDNSESTRRRL
jgi:hypothetical protein